MANTAYKSPPRAATALRKSRTNASPKSVTPAWGCLVLSDDSQRRDFFVRSAKSAGWLPYACQSVSEAFQTDQRQRTQLAIVDLGYQSAAHKSAFLQLVGQLASPQRLLLVCDEPDNGLAQTELLARQAGAWLYLPSPPLDNELQDLLKNARQIAAKITGFAGV